MLLKALYIISLKMNCLEGICKKRAAKHPLFHAILKIQVLTKGGACLIYFFHLGKEANYSKLKLFKVL